MEIHLTDGADKKATDYWTKKDAALWDDFYSILQDALDIYRMDPEFYDGHQKVMKEYRNNYLLDRNHCTVLAIRAACEGLGYNILFTKISKTKGHREYNLGFLQSVSSEGFNFSADGKRIN